MPSADCSLCGRHRPCAFASTAAPVCAGCALRRVIACARCGKLAPPTANWPEGPVCDPCYNAALRRRGTCAGCQANRRLVAPPGPDANLCAPTLLVPTLGRTTGPAIDGDQRWTLLARLLHDHDVDLTDRVAGSLLLSYGQQLSRIAVMTTDQIHHHADSVSVRFGSCDITVPEPLAGLLTELIDTGRRYRGVGSPATPSRWLSPVTSPAARSPQPASVNAYEPLACEHYPAGAPPSSNSPPKSRPPCWPTSCTSAQEPPPAGPETSAETGPATQPPSPWHEVTEADE